MLKYWNLSMESSAFELSKPPYSGFASGTLSSKKQRRKNPRLRHSNSVIMGNHGTEITYHPLYPQAVTSSWSRPRNADSNTLHITPEHILAASKLPRSHTVRRVLAMASVEGYLQRKTYKFSKEAEHILGFAVDLLGSQ